MYAPYSYDWPDEDEKNNLVEDAKLAGRRLREDRQSKINHLVAQYKAEETDHHLDVLIPERLETKSYPTARVLRDGWSVPGKPISRRNNRKGSGNAKLAGFKPWQSIRTFHRP